MKDFKESDKVQFGVDVKGWPVWDYRCNFRDVTYDLISGEVTSAKYAPTDSDFCVTYGYEGETRIWNFKQPSEIITENSYHEAYVRLVQPDPSKEQQEQDDEMYLKLTFLLGAFEGDTNVYLAYGEDVCLRFKSVKALHDFAKEILYEIVPEIVENDWVWLSEDDKLEFGGEQKDE